MQKQVSSRKAPYYPGYDSNLVLRYEVYIKSLRKFERESTQENVDAIMQAANEIGNVLVIKRAKEIVQDFHKGKSAVQ